MMCRRGGVWIFVIVILVLLVLLAFVAVLVVEQNDWFRKKEKEEVIPMIELYVRANDVDDPSYFFDASVEISYSINVTDEVFVARGSVRGDAYTPFLVPADRPVNVRCWNEGYYLVKVVKVHSSTELGVNRSVVDCSARKMGGLVISRSSGDLSRDYDIIKLNVTAVGGWWQRVGLCFEWTAGVIDVTTQDQWLSCDAGRWFNYSSYDKEADVYSWLPENQWRCGDELEFCEEVRSNRCKLPDAVVPYRYSGVVDRCVYSGRSLASGDSYELTLEVRTIDEKNSLDYVRVFFYDHDRRFDSSVNRWIWESAHYEQNIGAPDQEFIIPFDEERFRGVSP